MIHLLKFNSEIILNYVECMSTNSNTRFSVRIIVTLL